MTQKIKLTVVLLTIFCSLYAQQKGTGLVFVSEAEYKSIPLASTAMMGTLPSSKDLSEWFPTPGDQGEQSSCVAWAVGYGLKAYQEAVERRQNQHSLMKFSPAYIFNQIKISDCRNGSSIMTALNLLKKEGVASIDQFPYNPLDCSRQPSGEDKNNARPYAIAEWRTVPIGNEAEVKSHISSGFPVVIGMFVDEGFMRLGYNEIYQGPSGNEKGGHAMVVIGYDDSRQAFKVLNSWGINWGTSGYGWVSYTAFKNRVREAYSVQDIVINDPSNIPAVNPGPSPNIPVPLPSSNVSATLSPLTITHNVMVTTERGNFPGMIINSPGSISNGIGASSQVILRFYLANGSPLLANPLENAFRDINGLVAAGTPVVPVYSNPISGSVNFAVPYYALNFPYTGGVNSYQVFAVATLYINQFEHVKSPPLSMTIRY
ncbi:hypothetical protein J2X97_000739 [Epilithonimonas hungarica]|uniref:C1 family peptidase n=1 Tax=Epilithonimonas hungarica TaxID=454006 RepID=UPI00278B9A78|nr:C1 family peptidase [Epilithonimonas hungarica]MDP9955102.1 hypothetical protein [Epilithonimonas hungarica]